MALADRLHRLAVTEDRECLLERLEILDTQQHRRVRHGLIVPGKRRRRREDYRRWERGRAMELWQMDVVGRIFLADGTELHAVTGVDDHSRFCVCERPMHRRTARQRRDPFTLEAMQKIVRGPQPGCSRRSSTMRASTGGGI